jgi:general secretion pathway protein A
MYLSYYNLKHKPFQINTDPRFLWLGEKHKEALATLKYGIRDNKGFLLLTGEIGTGKTTLINALLGSLEENVTVATMSDPALNRLEFFQYIAIAFDIQQPITSKVDFLMHFSRFLQEAADSGRKVLLIIDEAQRLTHELLEEIRLLSNIEKQQAKLLNIFFIGQSEFNQVLEDPRNKALRQRISVNYHINTLSEAEVADYIRHRLLVAGSRKPLFSPDAVHQVYLYSGGFPRLINIICDRALLTGYVEDLKQVKGKIVKECARELELPQGAGRGAGNRWWRVRTRSEMKTGDSARSGGRRWRPALVGGAALVAAAGLIFFNAGGWDTGQELKEQLGGITADTVGGADGPDRQADAPSLSAAAAVTGPAAASSPVSAGMAPDQEKTPPASAGGEAAARARENAGTGGAGSGEVVAVADRKGTRAVPVITEEVLPEEPLVTAVAGKADNKQAAAGSGRLPAAPRGAGGARTRNFMINFDIDSNELSSGSFHELDRLAQLMRDNQELWAVVTGFTDTSGFYQYNKKISEARANMVKSYLVGRGIPPHKIQTFGKGPEDPVASNETLEGRELNRRVEIQLVKRQAEG